VRLSANWFIVALILFSLLPDFTWYRAVVNLKRLDHLLHDQGSTSNGTDLLRQDYS
jgi:hypothetical protein